MLTSDSIRMPFLRRRPRGSARVITGRSSGAGHLLAMHNRSPRTTASVRFKMASGRSGDSHGRSGQRLRPWRRKQASRSRRHQACWRHRRSDQLGRRSSPERRRGVRRHGPSRQSCPRSCANSGENAPGTTTSRSASSPPSPLGMATPATATTRGIRLERGEIEVGAHEQAVATIARERGHDGFPPVPVDLILGQCVVVRPEPKS